VGKYYYRYIDIHVYFYKNKLNIEDMYFYKDKQKAQIHLYSFGGYIV